MKKSLLYIVLILCALMMFACSSESEKEYVEAYDPEYILITDDRRIVYTVVYQLETKKMNENISVITAKVNELGGYIESSNKTRDDAVYRYRIKNDRVNEFIAFMDQNDEVVEKSISSRDITLRSSNSFESIDSLIEAKENWLEYLKKDSLTIDDIIKVNSYINDLDIKINKLKNEKKIIDESVEYSTVSVYFNSNPFIDDSFFSAYGQYLLGLLSLLIRVFMYLLPFGAITVGIIFIVKYRERKRQERKEKDKEVKENKE